MFTFFRAAAFFTFVLTVISCTMVHAQRDFAHLNFTKADSIAALYPKYSLENLQDLTARLTVSLSGDPEKFRAIYKWICNNIENDYTLQLKTTRKRQQLKNEDDYKAWNKTFTRQIIKQLIDEQTTVCSGYAYLLKEMASLAGLNCVIINGYGRTAQANVGGPGVANHSWNAVQLNGKWYLCDATWSSGAVNPADRTFIKKFDDAYFLADPVLFVRNHYPLDLTWSLLDSRPTLTEFLNRPLIYSGIHKLQITRFFPERFQVSAVKGKKFSFRFIKTGGDEIEKAALHIINGPVTKTIEAQIYYKPDGSYYIDHTFTTKGTYTVHIALNNQYIVTYSVKVGTKIKSTPIIHWR